MQVTLQEIASRAGKKPKGDRLYWSSEDIPRATQALQEILEENRPAAGDYCALDGVMPQPLSLALLNTINPFCSPAILDPKYGNGVVCIPRVTPKGQGSVLNFKVAEVKDFTLVEFAVPNGFIEASRLPDVVPPEVSRRKGVVIAGHGAYWLPGTIGLAYRHNPWVAIRRKEGGATIAIRSGATALSLGTNLPIEAVEDARTMLNAPKRGEVWFFEGPGGQHPCVVLSPDQRNMLSNDVIVAPLTSNVEKHAKSRSTVLVGSGSFGLDRDSAVLCGKISTIRKERLIDRARGQVDDATLDDILRHVVYAIGGDARALAPVNEGRI